MVSKISNFPSLENLQIGDYFISMNNEINTNVMFARVEDSGNRYKMDMFLNLPKMEIGNLLGIVESFSGIDFVKIDEKEIPSFLQKSDNFNYDSIFKANSLRKP